MLSPCITEAYSQLNLVYSEYQAQKVLELYEACMQRMGVAIVGGSASGKSTLWKLLEQALRIAKQDLVVYTMHPKACPRQILLGSLDMDTREWRDGILTRAARLSIKEPLTTRTWILCDGDIDPEWVESLNSVLDDNRLLTIPNGERVQFNANINFIFETDSLQFASPATVSRLAMLFCSNGLEQFAEQQAEVLRSKIGLNELALKQTLPRLMASSQSNSAVTIRNAISLLQKEMSEDIKPAMEKPVALLLPPSQRQQFKLEETEGFHSIHDQPFYLHQALLLPVHVMQRWMKANKSFLLTGPPATCKTQALYYSCNKLKGTKCATLYCNFQTTSADLVKLLMSNTNAYNALGGKVLRPKGCERLILYLKRLDYVRRDKYGHCELYAFLQYLLTYGGFYDVSSLQVMKIENVSVVCSAQSLSGIAKRTTDLFHHCLLEEPSNLEHVVTQQAKQTSPSASAIAPKLCEFFTLYRSAFPLQQRSLRDLFTWLARLKEADSATVCHHLFLDGLDGEDYQTAQKLFKKTFGEDSPPAKPLEQKLRYHLGQYKAFMLCLGDTGSGRHSALAHIGQQDKAVLFTPHLASTLNDSDAMPLDQAFKDMLVNAFSNSTIAIVEDHHLLNAKLVELLQLLHMSDDYTRFFAADEWSTISKNLLSGEDDPRLAFNQGVFKRLKVCLLVNPENIVGINKFSQWARVKSNRSPSGPPLVARQLETLYETLMSREAQTLGDRIQYFASGLKKLEEASAGIDVLRHKADADELILKQKQAEADKRLKEITEAMLKANDQQVFYIWVLKIFLITG